MATRTKDLGSQAVTADTTAAAISLTGVTGRTYLVSFYVSGATAVSLVPNGGSNAHTGHGTLAGTFSPSFGPFQVSDGAPGLYSSAGSACRVTVTDILAEG